jgi:DNA-binding response OmpR family regulator
MTMATILIVDDHPHILQLLQRELAAASHHVLTALSGEEALTQVEQEHPALIVLDVALPGMGGFEVLSALKANPTTATIPVVMLSARDHPSDMAHGLEIGADWYLTKPFRPGEVSLLARRFLAEPDATATSHSGSTNPALPSLEGDREDHVLPPGRTRITVPA